MLEMQITQSIPSKLELIPEFVKGLLDRIKERVSDEGLLFDIRLCLEEALINAVKYGNKMEASLPVEVKVEILPDKLSFEVKDQGKGFDYQSLPDPTSGDNLEKSSGRGIYLIKKLMDEVKFFDGGSRIMMVKFITKKEAGNEDTGRGKR